MKLVLNIAGVAYSLLWIAILIDFVGTLIFGWKGRDLSFGFAFLLVWPIIPVGCFVVARYLKTLEGDMN